jgi:hypothetical protein
LNTYTLIHSLNMDYSTIVRREQERHSSGLGLGWLLAVAIGGGILIFAAVGCLLAWRIQRTGQPCTTRVYSMGNADTERRGSINGPNTSHFEHLPPDSTAGLSSLTASSTTKLLKKSFFRSDSSWSQLSSKTSLRGGLPPVLPPLPTYQGFLTRQKTRDINARLESDRAAWVVDEEAVHGPVIKRLSFRESWFSKEAWLARSPTLPNVSGGEDIAVNEDRQQIQESQQQDQLDTGAQTQTQTLTQTQTQPQRQDIEQHRQPEQPPAGQKIEIQKRQSKILNTSQTTPQLSNDDDHVVRGRQRAVAQTQDPPVRPCATETDLRVILASTEKRLLEGASRSPSKKAFNLNASPTKTPPRSGRAGTPGRVGSMTPSPSKKNVGTPKTTHSHSASMSSIGSAAKSLINLATEELELPAGQGSPRRQRVRDWEPLRQVHQTTQPKEHKPDQQAAQEAAQRQVEKQQQQQQQQPQQPQPPQARRSSSVKSDVSSSLSTLYSVGDPEDVGLTAAPPKMTRGGMQGHVRQGVSTISDLGSDHPIEEDRQLGTTRQQLTGPRPFKRSKTVGGRPMTDASAIPAPLRTISVNSRIGRTGANDGLKTESFRLTVLQQGHRRSRKVVQSEAQSATTPNLVGDHLSPNGHKRESLSAASSESSMVSVPVYSQATANDLPRLPKAEEQLRAREAAMTPPVSSPETVRGLDLPSSPLNEHEVLSMLMASTRPRNLPTPPPSRIFALRDDAAIPAPLNPRPKSRHGSVMTPAISSSGPQFMPPCPPPFSSSGGLGAFPVSLTRRASTSSSVYDQDSISTAILEEEATDLPSRRATTGGDLKTVGSTIAELRRMDSVYSVASLASTYFR